MNNFTFTAPTSFTVNTYPTDLTYADFNKDGKLDIATSNLHSNDVSILLGNGNGSFQTAVNFLVDTSPVAIKTSDFNNDNNTDIVTTNNNSPGTISILLGNGKGGFVSVRNFAVGGFNQDVAVADFNNDGNADIISTNSFSASILLGSGDGSFPTVNNAYDTFSGYASGVAVADFNNDGIKDFAIVSNYQSSSQNRGIAYIRLGNGDGSFKTSSNYGTVGANPMKVAAADFNGDGKMDIVSADYSAQGITVLEGKGDGTFVSRNAYSVYGGKPWGIAIADINGDGKVDVATANYQSTSLSVFIGNGNLTMQQALTYSVSGHLQGITLADFNNDSRVDMLSSSVDSNSVSLLLNIIPSSSPSASGTITISSSATATASPIWTMSSTVSFTPSITTSKSNTASHTKSISTTSSHSSSTSAAPQPRVVELSHLNGQNGFTINGKTTNDMLGNSISRAGDFNGDGKSDFITSSVSNNPSGGSNPGLIDYTGQSYLVFGRDSSYGSTLSLSSLSANEGVTFNGPAPFSQSGCAVNNAGDINADGTDDIIITACDASLLGKENAGQAYIIYGKSSFSSPVLLSSITSSNGFVINGINAGDGLGQSASGGGDINGDGIDDIIIGAGSANVGTLGGAGQVYVIFGKTIAFSSPFSLTLLNGTNGFTINGINQYDGLGSAVSIVGDINNDGFDDILISATDADPSSKSSAGQAYVILGKSSFSSSTFSLSSLNGNNGFTINGLNSNDHLGSSVAGLGDINNDGYDDIGIGAPDADPNSKNSAGQAYVILGKSSFFSPTFSLSSLNGANGFIINGINAEDNCGQGINGIRDVSGDGISDIIIGATGVTTSNGGNGECYVLYGKSTAFPAIYNLTSLLSDSGFFIEGTDSSYIGGPFSGIGDINNDGFDDIAIGAPMKSTLYVVYGSGQPRPTPTSSISHSSSPSAYVVNNIIAGGSYDGTNDRENFIINTDQNVQISSNGGEDRFTIFPNGNMNITVSDFSKAYDKIDLTNFANITSINDLTITFGSAIVNLPNNQKFIAQNLTPSDLTENNFIFAPVPADISSYSSSSNVNLIVGVVVAAVAFISVAVAVAYKFYHRHASENLVSPGAIETKIIDYVVTSAPHQVIQLGGEIDNELIAS